MTNEEAKIMLLGYMYWHKKGFNKNVFGALCHAIDVLNDSNEIKYAKNINEKSKEHCEFKCSVCNVEIGTIEGGSMDGGYFNYCPNCGARIVEDLDEDN